MRIQNGGWLGLPHATRAALAHGNVLVFPPRLALHDFSQGSDADKLWLVHELAHVWQWQRGFRLWRHGAQIALRGGYGKQRNAYCYQHLLCTPLSFCHLNMEQQADVLAHYFNATLLSGDGGVPQRRVHMVPHYRQLLAGFLADPADPALLPQRPLKKQKTGASAPVAVMLCRVTT